MKKFFSQSLNSKYLFGLWISDRFSMLCSKLNQLFLKKKFRLLRLHRARNCWCLRGWCYEIITFMRISISKTSRYVVSNLLLLEILISAFVFESLSSRSESRHEESVCIFLMLFPILKILKNICVSVGYRDCECFGDCLCSQMNEYPLCKSSDGKRGTDCGSGLPPVSILQPVDVACLSGLWV